jgi:hypothetical protein
MTRVLFLGGNGHCQARLAPARAAAAALAASGEIAALEIAEVAYPGFEGRTAPADRASFLTGLADAVQEAEARAPVRLAYATGIGALFAVALRLDGRLERVPLVLQGPVLWGLERRWIPRLARAGLAGMIPRLMTLPAYRAHFARTHFGPAVSEETRRAFFEGYSRCAVSAHLFRWFDPSLLRELEARAAALPRALDDVKVWWGGRDGVVAPRELEWTRRAPRTGSDRWRLPPSALRPL